MARARANARLERMPKLGCGLFFMLYRFSLFHLSSLSASAWRRIRKICCTSICTDAKLQNALTGAASLWGEHLPRIEVGILDAIPSVRPPIPHLPASMRFTIRSPASSLKRISQRDIQQTIR